MHVVAILAVIGLLGAGAGTLYVTDELGYLPSEKNLQIEQPLGYRQICTSCVEKKYQNIINQIPNLDKINYEIYESDYSHLEIYIDYKQRLENDGYNQEVIGSKIVDGVHIRYYGFLKGLVAVGIAVAPGQDVGYSSESVVLYTTGSALDYQEMIDWYNGLDGNIENPNLAGSNNGGEL